MSITLVVSDSYQIMICAHLYRVGQLLADLRSNLQFISVGRRFALIIVIVVIIVSPIMSM